MYQMASGFAVVGVAVRIQKTDGKITLARIGVTGLSNRAYRAKAAEEALQGTSGSAADVQKAAALVDKGVDANADIHASADYRRQMARVYAARSIGAALARNA
jgi:carbon-monoxide dehydrogenase medium subunit